MSKKKLQKFVNKLHKTGALSVPPASLQTAIEKHAKK